MYSIQQRQQRLNNTFLAKKLLQNFLIYSIPGGLSISNSKSQFSNTRLGDAARVGDRKPEFLRHLSSWMKSWQSMRMPNTQSFTLSKQTADALMTAKSTASIIEELLNEGFSYVLTSLFQSGSVERRFSNIDKCQVDALLIVYAKSKAQKRSCKENLY